MKIGQRLAELREKRGWTQDQIADLLGIKRARYNSWENDIARPDIEFVDKLAEIHKVTADYLLGRSKEPFAPEWATSKDIADFKKMLENDTEIMFDGVPMDEDSRRRVMDVLTGLFWEAKQMNKKTYGRKSKKTKDEE